ncbi:hypothetical protein PR048_006537 [Dryococelus australis]|uniref:Uncharacterized protein n=1 Tax=Dryococelus australis TaxID=614101 RepID=A0ABQ9IBA6_9NEOP|nr:hypothetical protein PR048_006537 [Dryococelus australis]
MWCTTSCRYHISTSVTSIEVTPRPIIVKFTSYRRRNEVFRAKRFLTKSGVTKSEDLTMERLALLNAAIAKYGLHNVYTADGRIVVKSGARRFHISRSEELKTANFFDTLIISYFRVQLYLPTNRCCRVLPPAVSNCVPPQQLSLRRTLAMLFLPILTVYRLLTSIPSLCCGTSMKRGEFLRHSLCIESWLKSSLSAMLVSLSGYKIFRNGRINKGGGGVVIYYAGKPQFIIIELTIPPNKVILPVVYRPPKAADLYDFEEALYNLIVCYFNINLLSNTNEANMLLTTLSCMDIIVCPLGATHHTAWIDLMLTSKPKLTLTHGQTTLNSDAALMLWHEINVIDTLDRKISRFSQVITDLYNRTVPLRTRRVTKAHAPWLTNDIVQLMRKRDNTYSRYKRDIRTCS